MRAALEVALLLVLGAVNLAVGIAADGPWRFLGFIGLACLLAAGDVARLELRRRRARRLRDRRAGYVHRR
jgi:hypothetical protein